jgi:hypothetical protein
LPGFATGSRYERRSGLDRREGTGRRVFEVGWIEQFEPNRRSGGDRRQADRRIPPHALTWLHLSPSVTAPIRRNARAAPTQ